ncbi:MAG TPA: hypothetical protein PLD88_04860, partial [Candidatus Berkiella sp.]|nr:hypothetical protein [Candidatus Berkiella sp.]
MMVYLTHPAHEKTDLNKISTMLDHINNWNMLLETYHLDIAKETSFETLRLSFIKYFLAFQQMSIEKGIFFPFLPKQLDSLVDFFNKSQTDQFVIPNQMKLPLS